MKQHTPHTLKDLPTLFKTQKTELTKEQIDGTAFTTNPDLQFRRSRIITDADLAKYKRPTKIKELLNYCKFRLGELATCAKPSASILNVLYWYKKGDLDKVSPGYMEAIKDYRELVDSAIVVDLRKSKKQKAAKLKSNKRRHRQLQTIKIDDITITTKGKKDQTIKCAKEFIEWLDLQSVAMPWTIEEPNKYIKQIRSYVTNSKAVLPAIKQILDQRKWLLETYQFEKAGKKLILVQRKQDNTLDYAKQDTDATVRQIEELTGIDNTVQPEHSVNQSILEQFVSQLKDLGIKEFSIKF